MAGKLLACCSMERVFGRLHAGLAQYNHILSFRPTSCIDIAFQHHVLLQQGLALWPGLLPYTSVLLLLPELQVGQQLTQTAVLGLQCQMLMDVRSVQPVFTHPSHSAEALSQTLTAPPKFLLILDDLWEDGCRLEQLRWLLPSAVVNMCSMAGSWVVVTTRNRGIATRLLGPGMACLMPVSAFKETDDCGVGIVHARLLLAALWLGITMSGCAQHCSGWQPLVLDCHGCSHVGEIYWCVCQNIA